MISTAVLAGGMSAPVVVANGPNYLISGYRVQLPVDASGGKSAGGAITDSDLSDLSPPYLIAGIGSYIFITPSDGATTSGSNFPRTELRDLIDRPFDEVSTDKVVLQASVPTGLGAIVLQSLDAFGPAFKIEFTGGTPGLSDGLLRIKYDGTEGGAETIRPLISGIATDIDGLSSVLSIRVKRYPNKIEVYHSANVDGTVPDWTSANGTDPAFLRTAASGTYYWKKGNYFQNNSTSPVYTSYVYHFDGTLPAPVTLVAGGGVGAGQTVTVSQSGASFTVADVTASGVTADGVLYVKVGANGAILSTSPASAQLTRANGATTFGTGPYWSHGLMSRPGNAAATFPSAQTATLGQRQTVFHGVPTVTDAAGGTTTWDGGQGFDAFLGWTGTPAKATTNWPYKHSKNIDPGATGVPLALTTGQVLVKALSNLTTVPSNARPAITKLIPLVVYGPSDPLPGVNDISPAPAAPSIVTRYRFDQMVDPATLPNLAVTTGATFKSASVLANMFERKTYLASLDTSGRNLNPTNGDGAPVYPGDNWKQMEAVLQCCTNRLTVAEKTLVLKAAVPHFAHMAERFNEGLVGGTNGGNDGAFKSGIAFACYMLGNPTFLLNALGLTVQGTVPPASFGAAGAIGMPVYESMFFLVTQGMIDAPLYPNFPFPQNWLGGGSYGDSGNAVIGSQHCFDIGINHTNNAKSGYLHINAMTVSPGALMQHVLGITNLTLPSSAAMLRFADIYMQRRIQTGQPMPDAFGNDPINNGIAWLGDMWAQHRGTSNLFVAPSYPSAITLVTTSPISGSAGPIVVSLQAGYIYINFSSEPEAVPGTQTGAVQIWDNASGTMALRTSMDFPTAIAAVFTKTAGKVWFAGRTMAIAAPSGGWVVGRTYQIRIAAGVIRNKESTGNTFAGATGATIQFTA